MSRSGASVLRGIACARQLRDAGSSEVHTTKSRNTQKVRPLQDSNYRDQTIESVSALALSENFGSHKCFPLISFAQHFLQSGINAEHDHPVLAIQKDQRRRGSRDHDKDVAMVRLYASIFPRGNGGGIRRVRALPVANGCSTGGLPN